MVIDITGQRFGRLTAVSPGAKSGSGGGRFWVCACDCGKAVEVTSRNLRASKTKSCGCITTTHGMHKTPTYKSWMAMKYRCLYPKHPKFHLYGGAGVRICDRWIDSFANFLADVGERPNGMTLDRHPNPAGDYEPGNVRWASPLEQRLNRKTNKVTEDLVSSIRSRSNGGESASAIARSVGLSPRAVQNIVMRRTWRHVP